MPSCHVPCIARLESGVRHPLHGTSEGCQDVAGKYEIWDEVSSIVWLTSLPSAKNEVRERRNQGLSRHKITRRSSEGGSGSGCGALPNAPFLVKSDTTKKRVK